MIFGGIYLFACVFMILGSVLTLGAGAIYGLTWGVVTVSPASTIGAMAAFIVDGAARKAMAQAAPLRPRIPTMRFVH